MTITAHKIAKNQAFAVMTIILGAIGLLASFELATEYMRTLQNPEYVPNCEVSVLVTCGPNMGSAQGSVLGFSNTVLGLAAYAAPVVVGFAQLAGAKFAGWFWWCYRVGLLMGVAFVFWLAFQSVYRIGTLCPWCMVAWVATIPLFFCTLFKPEAANFYPVAPGIRKTFKNLHSWAWVWVTLSYLLIAIAAQLQLDWFAEFSR